MTDEELEGLLEARNQRLIAEKQSMNAATSDRPQAPPAQSGRIGDLELFKRMGIGRA